jgi:hypothetical protein
MLKTKLAETVYCLEQAMGLVGGKQDSVCCSIWRNKFYGV